MVGFENYVTFFTRSDATKVLGPPPSHPRHRRRFHGSGPAGGPRPELQIRGTTFARSAVFAPYVLSGVGVGLVWLFIFDPGYGYSPGCCAASAQQSPQWINDPQLSLVMVIIVYVWKNLGSCAVVYLAGLQSLPQDVMEAASLDGANGFKRFVSMALPLLSPTPFFLLITTMLARCGPLT